MENSSNKHLTPTNLSFESLKKLNQYGVEYWSARDLQACLGYSKWQRFEPAIKKAMESCKQSGNDPKNHFTGAGKMVEIGSQTEREVNDYHLSRFACYLIAQNGDPRKPEIAEAQKYFAVQTRRQELSDEMAADLERLELRKQASVEFKALSGAARDASVQNKMFGVFHDAGYKVPKRRSSSISCKPFFLANTMSREPLESATRRQDELGTPYCVTIDFETLENDTVTLRDRDSMQQIRLAASDLFSLLQQKLQ